MYIFIVFTISVHYVRLPESFLKLKFKCHITPVETSAQIDFLWMEKLGGEDLTVFCRA